MLGNKLEFWDYLDLLFFNLSKINRKKLVSDEASLEFYEDFFTSVDDENFFSGVDSRKTLKSRVLIEAMANGKASNILDAGCGIGDNIFEMYDGENIYQGVDYSEANIKVARGRLPKEVKLQQGSITDLEFGDKQFDYVTCIEVLEHIPDQFQALRELNRVLKDDGRLVLSVPFRHWFKSYYSKMGHIRHYTQSDLSNVLKEAGFDVVEWLPNYPKWHRLANYCYIISRVVAIAYRLVGVRRGPHNVKLPFSKRLLIIQLMDRIEKIRLREAGLDYSTMETSTFVIAMPHKNICSQEGGK